MPKSKEFIDNTDSENEKNGPSSEEETTKSAVSKKSKAKTKNDPPAKRVKKNEDADQNDEVSSTIGPNGERLYEIGKLRFVSVSQFKGKSYINIREYYEDSGVQKPGKKGISLAIEQWEKLKSLINQVDKDLKKQ